MTYKKQPERVSDTLHKQLILSEVFLINIEHFAVVDPADEEQGDKEPDDNVDAGECKEPGGQTQGQSEGLTTPEHEV